jgi:transposase
MSAFLRELLEGEEAWTAPRLLEALKRRFFVTFHPVTVRRKLLEMGYQWKRTRYVPTGKPTAEEKERFAAALGEAERGAEGVLSG